MEHREEVPDALLPSDQDPSKAIHPRMRPLDNPSARTLTEFALQLSSFLAAASDVSGVAEFGGELADLIKVESLVEAESLRTSAGGLGSIDVDALDRRPRQFHVMPVGAVHRETDRNAARVGQ